MNGSQPEHVFDETQIGKGLKPLAQHGYVVIDHGTLTLLGSQEQPIASAPLPQISAKKSSMSLGQAVSVSMNGEHYNVSPGWGRYRWIAALGIMAMRKNTRRLLELIEAGGGRI
jgi:hypothetical protein